MSFFGGDAIFFKFSSVARQARPAGGAKRAAVSEVYKLF